MTWRLQYAIHMRERVREALDRDDMQAVRSLNRIADAAYLELDSFESLAYLAWVRAPEGFKLAMGPA